VSFGCQMVSVVMDLIHFPAVHSGVWWSLLFYHGVLCWIIEFFKIEQMCCQEDHVLSCPMLDKHLCLCNVCSMSLQTAVNSFPENRCCWKFNKFLKQRIHNWQINGIILDSSIEHEKIDVDIIHASAKEDLHHGCTESQFCNDQLFVCHEPFRWWATN